MELVIYVYIWRYSLMTRNCRSIQDGVCFRFLHFIISPLVSSLQKGCRCLHKCMRGLSQKMRFEGRCQVVCVSKTTEREVTSGKWASVRAGWPICSGTNSVCLHLLRVDIFITHTPRRDQKRQQGTLFRSHLGHCLKQAKIKCKMCVEQVKISLSSLSCALSSRLSCLALAACGAVSTALCHLCYCLHWHRHPPCSLSYWLSVTRAATAMLPCGWLRPLSDWLQRGVKPHSFSC